MSYDNIIEKIRERISLEEVEARFLESRLIPRPFKRGEKLAVAGEPARYLLFIEKGYLMTYFTDNRQSDQVVQFSTAGWWAGDMYSLDEERNFFYTTRALTDGEALLLPITSQQEILTRYPIFEKYFRKLFQGALKCHQIRFLEYYSLNTQERYQQFLETHPGIEQFAAQKDIASFLGITPEFLSRIRSKLLRENY